MNNADIREDLNVVSVGINYNQHRECVVRMLEGTKSASSKCSRGIRDNDKHIHCN
jgi:hypothetical protein